MQTGSYLEEDDIVRLEDVYGRIKKIEQLYFFNSDIITQMKTKALITGVTGQDGALLSEFLLSKNYEVYGIKEDHLLLIQKELIISIKTLMRI